MPEDAAPPQPQPEPAVPAGEEAAPSLERKEELLPVEEKISELDESQSQLMGRLRGLKEDLLNWRSSLDTQVTKYKSVSFSTLQLMLYIIRVGENPESYVFFLVVVPSMPILCIPNFQNNSLYSIM
jgi:hypothetical protein